MGRPCFTPMTAVRVSHRQRTEICGDREDLKETMEYISGYSLYSYEDEVRQGFLTVQGGHRVGVTER